MFIAAILLLLLISFLLSLKSLKTVNEKPGIKEVKKSLDKQRVIFHNHSSKKT